MQPEVSSAMRAEEHTAWKFNILEGAAFKETIFDEDTTCCFGRVRVGLCYSVDHHDAGLFIRARHLHDKRFYCG